MRMEDGAARASGRAHGGIRVRWILPRSDRRLHARRAPATQGKKPPEHIKGGIALRARHLGHRAGCLILGPRQTSTHPTCRPRHDPGMRKGPPAQPSRPEPTIHGEPRSGKGANDPSHHQKDVRRRPTLPHPTECSTIGAVELSYRVRNGTGRFPDAMTAVTRRDNQTPTTTPPQKG